MKLDFDSMDVGTAVNIEPSNEGDRDELFTGLVDWLQENGFITFGQQSERGIYTTSLTEKGFNILGAKPLQSEKSLGSKMKDVALTATKEGAKAIISELVKMAFSGAGLKF